MADMTEICKKRYESILGKRLYLWPQNLGTFYTYHGDKSQHGWHVDPRNVDYIYNLIVCVDRIGDISPFMYKDKNGTEHQYVTQIGDAILFRGGTTVHQVPNNTDPHSKRVVLSLQFTSIPLVSTKDENSLKTMCTFIAGVIDKFNFGTQHRTVSIGSLGDVAMLGRNPNQLFFSYLSFSFAPLISSFSNQLFFI